MKLNDRINQIIPPFSSILTLLLIGCGSWMPFAGDEKPEEEKEVTPPPPEPREIAASSFQLTPTEKLKIKDNGGSEIGEINLKSALISIGNITISKGTASEQIFDKKHILNMKDGKVYGQAFDYSFDDRSFTSIDLSFVTVDIPPPELNFAGLLKKHSVIVLGQAEIDSESQPVALQINPEKLISFSLPDDKNLVSEVALKLNINNLFDFSGTNLDKQKIVDIIKTKSSDQRLEFASTIERNLQNSVSYTATGPELSEELNLPSKVITAPIQSDSQVKPEVLINEDTGLISQVENSIVATTVIPTTIAELPAPAGISFVDENLENEKLSGTVTILRSTSEVLIDSYSLYWGTSDSTKLFESAIIILEKDSESLTFQLGSSTTIPEGATHFLAFSRNSSGESTLAASIEIQDNVQAETPIVFSPPPKSVDDGERYGSTTNTPQISWIPPDDISTIAHYEIALGTTQGNTNILNWTNVGLVNAYQHIGPIPNGERIFASVRSVSTTATASQPMFSDGYQNLLCPNDLTESGVGAYLKIFGNTTKGLGGKYYTEGTQTKLDWSVVSSNNNWTPNANPRKISDFCVAKYEMKLRITDPNVVSSEDTDYGFFSVDTEAKRNAVKAVSIPQEHPWRIDKVGFETNAIGAIQICEDLGAGFRLIDNAQWQAIAREIENTPINWSRSSPDSTKHFINRGHTSPVPPIVVAIPADVTEDPDDDPCVGTLFPNCTEKAKEGYLQKRTHSLTSSEGDIWDFGGNITEYIHYQNHRIDGHGLNGARLETPAYLSDSVGNTDQDKEEFKLQWGPEGNYQNLYGYLIGGMGEFRDTQGLSDEDPSTPGIVTRSGWIIGSTLAGIYATFVTKTWVGSTSSNGFRCVYAP